MRKATKTCLQTKKKKKPKCQTVCLFCWIAAGDHIACQCCFNTYVTDEAQYTGKCPFSVIALI